MFYIIMVMGWSFYDGIEYEFFQYEIGFKILRKKFDGFLILKFKEVLKL
jgi:hypothetical protein